MKIKDVRLRGCGFTLFPAAKEEGVDEELMYLILRTIYQKTEIIDEKGMYTKDSINIERKNPDMVVKFEAADFGDQFSKLKEAGLIDENGKLTEKSMKVLEKASKIQKKLDEEGFHCCPCKGYC